MATPASGHPVSGWRPSVVRVLRNNDKIQRVGEREQTRSSDVVSIFRKFGVSNRAALMALWLGKV